MVVSNFLCAVACTSQSSEPTRAGSGLQGRMEGADVLAELRATLAATSHFEEASWGLAVTLRLQDACAC